MSTVDVSHTVKKNPVVFTEKNWQLESPEKIRKIYSKMVMAFTVQLVHFTVKSSI